MDNYHSYWSCDAKIGRFLTVPFSRNSLDRDPWTRDTSLLAAVGECKRSPDCLLRTIVRIGLGSNSGHHGTRRSLESGSRRRSA